MAIPSKAEQARKLAEWLEAGAEAEESIDRFALRLVDAFHEMLKSGLKEQPYRPQAGEAFKSPLSAKVYWLAWEGVDQVWITQADSTHGWLAKKGDPFFDYATPSTANVGKPGKNKDWAVGSIVSAFQGALRYSVVAVHDRGVLLRDVYGDIVLPQSNDEMSKYYTMESES